LSKYTRYVEDKQAMALKSGDAYLAGESRNCFKQLILSIFAQLIE